MAEPLDLDAEIQKLRDCMAASPGGTTYGLDLAEKMAAELRATRGEYQHAYAMWREWAARAERAEAERDCEDLRAQHAEEVSEQWRARAEKAEAERDVKDEEAMLNRIFKEDAERQIHGAVVRAEKAEAAIEVLRAELADRNDAALEEGRSTYWRHRTERAEAAARSSHMDYAAEVKRAERAEAATARVRAVCDDVNKGTWTERFAERIRAALDDTDG